MEKISVHAILEVLGRPAQNVLDALNSLIDKMKLEKELTILSSTVHEPVPVKDTKDLFTSFAEVDLEFPSLYHLFGFLFIYMPSNVEINYPEKISLSNSDLNQLTNQLMHRLHQYDAIAKNAINERELAMRKLYEVAPHLFKQANNQQQAQEKVKETKVKKTEKKVSKKKKK